MSLKALDLRITLEKNLFSGTKVHAAPKVLLFYSFLSGVLFLMCLTLVVLLSK